MIYLDLVGFKGLNDVPGHDAGDLLLKLVAARLGHTLRAAHRCGQRPRDFLQARPLSRSRDVARVFVAAQPAQMESRAMHS